MTNFQKLIVIIAVSAIGIAGFYLYRQEQIKKDELVLKERQQKVSECKYFLNNKDLIIKKESEDLDTAISALLRKADSEEKRKRLDAFYEKTADAFLKAKKEYEKSADDCRDILRRLGEENS